MAVGVALLAAAAWLSHRLQLPDPMKIDGRGVRVVQILDGDTLLVECEFGRVPLRLRGIDAPDRDPPAHGSLEAHRYLQARLRAGSVVLKFDPPQTRDADGRLLAFAYLEGGECVNLSLVRDGHAYADRRMESFMRSQLEQAETRARQRKVGLWKDITDEQQPAWRQAWLARNRASH